MRLQRRRRFVLGASVLLLGAMLSLPVIAYIAARTAEEDAYGEGAVAIMSDGVYLASGGRYFRLGGWNLPYVDPPPDSPEVPTVDAIVVVRKVLESNESYRLYSIADHRPIPWESSETAERTLTLVSEPVEAGSYVLTVPSASFYGGETYHYFVLTEGSPDLE